MGILDAIFGRKKPALAELPSPELKIKLIRAFIKKRTIQDPMAVALGYTPDMADALPIPILMGMPEATLVTIVESYAILKRQGLNDAIALAAIERGRPDGFDGDMPDGMTLEAYTGFRVTKEHTGGAVLSDKHIFECVELTRRLYRC